MFEKRKRWTGWTLALAMMLSLAPQGAMAAEMTPPAVQEASGASSSAPGETVEPAWRLDHPQVRKVALEATERKLFSRELMHRRAVQVKTHSQELMRRRTAQMKLYRQERMRQRTARRKTSSQEQMRLGT